MFYITKIFLIPYSIFYERAAAATDALYSLLEREQYRNLVDFDNHLDNITLDWQNHKLNKVIDETVEEHE